MFDITRIYHDEEGESHFEDRQIPLHDAGAIGYLSKHYPVKDIIFREVAADYDYDFHTAPQKQFLVLLDVGVEIETSRGEKRTFLPGNVLLLEDTLGKGHRTRNLLSQKRRSVFITLHDNHAPLL